MSLFTIFILTHISLKPNLFFKELNSSQSLFEQMLH